MTDWPVLTLIGAVALAAIHLLAARVAAMGASLRGRWLSLAGGVSVAYVFVHVLPELSEGTMTLAEAGLLAGAVLAGWARWASSTRTPTTTSCWRRSGR
jgi:hypothetical protein